MAAPVFPAAPTQPFRMNGLSSQPPFSLSVGGTSSPFDRDASIKPVGTPYATTPSPASQVLIRRLPSDTTEEKLRLMVIFSQELVDVEMLSPDQSEDLGYRSAILKFKSPAGAQQTKDILNGKSISNDAEMIVEVLSGSPNLARRYPSDSVPTTATSATSSTASSTTSSGGASRQTSSRFNGTFKSMEKRSPPLNGMYGSSELANPESSAHYQSIFSPQSPIGNHLTDRGRMSGKTLINSAEDDETRELLKDPVAYAENGLKGPVAFTENGVTQPFGRRATAPHIPITQMKNLSLNTTSPGPASMPQFGHPAMTPLSSHGNPMSPTMINNASHSINYQMSGGHFQQRPHNFPPVNPADQNPPCNTLYVGNLPIDTSEEELKAMFSKQRGYKRLCFRTKQNGPMCFVEFEDISFATKALHDLYGHPLHNSVKGGIRLSFSKNPLGVRSGQAPGQAGASNTVGVSNVMAGAPNGFTTANGPPPGLAAPPGLNRMPYGAGATNAPYSSANYPREPGNPWESPAYGNGPMSAGGLSSATANGGPAMPPYMMGKY